jgi:lipoprotein-releasing system ATP-binding protein
MNENVFLKSEKAQKKFGRGTAAVQAVRETDLNLREGERVFIHGPSGAGKSTLLHMLGGLATPSSGGIFYRGKEIYALRDRQRSRIRNRAFGFVFQFFYLLPELSVIDNIMLPAFIKGGGNAADIKTRAKRLLDITALQDRAGHRPGQLSGGEGQRAAIARALINDPEILFCDEPTGNLDSASSSMVYSLIEELCSYRRMSVVIVSHQDIRSFLRIDRSLYMEDGYISEDTGAVGEPESAGRRAAGRKV